MQSLRFHVSSGIQVMIFGGVGTAHTTKNHYRLRTIRTLIQVGYKRCDRGLNPALSSFSIPSWNAKT